MNRGKWLLHCIAIGAVGCAQSIGPGQSAAQAKKSAGRIVVSPQSNVCVSVQADQRIWPRPIDAEVARALSGNLMSGIRRLYEQRGGSLRIPGTHNEARFVTNVRGASPDCKDHGTDVFVEMRYEPRIDGKPFLLRYWITRGAAVRHDSIDVDVREEIQSGRIKGYSQRRTNAVIIGEDTRSRAQAIVDQLTTDSL